MKAKDIKKIDIHVHTSMWEGAQINTGYELASPEQLIEKYKELGIEKGFLLPLISPEHRFCVQTNEEMQYVAEKYSDSFYWFCNIDPRMGENSPTTDFSVFLEHYKKRGAIGMGEVTASLRFDDPLMENLFYHCGECDMPVTIHIAPQSNGYYGILDELGLPGLEHILKKYPKLKIVGHSQCFWSHISADVNAGNWDGYPKGPVTPGRIVELMREYPNLYGDMSAGSGFTAISRDPDFGYRFIEEFSDRLMFATDICNNSNIIYLAGWLEDGFESGCISEENYKKLCRENAVSLYKL